MIILEKPYVSDFLVETIKKNGFKVLDNIVAREYFNKEELTSTAEAIKLYRNGEKFYTNSENSIQWIDENLDESDLKKYIEISKNKILFRRKISKIYPDFYFKEVNLSDLKNLNFSELKIPFVIKPSVGFLSFGVYSIKSSEDWDNFLLNINDEMDKISSIFPKNVVNSTKFIIEELIEGKEFAVDTYYNDEGEAVILNIFEHPFFDEKDVSDRIYLTSKKIFHDYYEIFLDVLNKIGTCMGLKNYPSHIELRISPSGVVPIEINPMRFCGWCLTDIAQKAWGINVYRYYFKGLKPNWNEILSKKGDEIYYFTIADMPKDIKKSVDIDYEGYLKNINNVLDFRKVDYSTNPIFAMVFAKTNSYDEIKKILKLDMNKYVKITEQRDCERGESPALKNSRLCGS